jgi:hypothetical protein
MSQRTILIVGVTPSRVAGSAAFQNEVDALEQSRGSVFWSRSSAGQFVTIVPAWSEQVYLSRVADVARRHRAEITLDSTGALDPTAS